MRVTGVLAVVVSVDGVIVWLVVGILKINRRIT